MINFIKKHYFAIILSFILILFLPSTIMMPALTNTRAIATGISIDKKGEEFSVAIQLITPQSNISNNENLEIVDDTGRSIIECFANLSIKLGKEIGLEHVNIIILSDSLKDEDIMNLFDLLYRYTKITLSTIIVQTNNEAQKLLESSAELNNNSSSSLQNNLGFNNEVVETAHVTTLGEFFDDYFSFSGVSLIPYVETPKEESGGGSGGSGGSSQGGEESGGGGGSGGGSPVQPLVQNKGESSVYKKGRLVGKISQDLSRGLNWMMGSNSRGLIELEGVSDNRYYFNADVVLTVEKFDTKTNYSVKNNKLNLDVNIDVYALVAEIVESGGRTKYLMENTANYLTDKVKEKATQKIKQDIKKSVDYCKENNVDILKIYDKFYKFNKEKFKDVLRVYGEEYLNSLQININIEIHPFK